MRWCSLSISAWIRGAMASASAVSTRRTASANSSSRRAPLPNNSMLLFGSGARRDEEFAEAVRRVETALADAIAPLIQADIDSEHQRILAYGLVGLAESTSRRLVHTGQDFDAERVALQVADLAWAGLR